MVNSNVFVPKGIQHMANSNKAACFVIVQKIKKHYTKKHTKFRNIMLKLLQKMYNIVFLIILFNTIIVYGRLRKILEDRVENNKIITIPHHI